MKKSLGLVLLLFISLAAAESVPNSLNLNLQTTDSSGNPVTGTFSFVFNLTTQSDCSNAFYSNRTTLTTDSRGIISYTLANINSNFDQKTYLCYYRDGVLKSNTPIAQVPNAIRAKNVTVSGLIPDTNLNLSTVNVTSNWLFGKINWSDIQAVPAFLLSESDPRWSANFTNMKVDCPTGNYAYGILGNGTLKCRSDVSDSTGNSSWNQSLADSSYIKLNGNSTTTASIPFAEGLNVPKTKNVRIGNWTIYQTTEAEPILHIASDFPAITPYGYVSIENQRLQVSNGINVYDGPLQFFGTAGAEMIYSDLEPEMKIHIVDYVTTAHFNISNRYPVENYLDGNWSVTKQLKLYDKICTTTNCYTLEGLATDGGWQPNNATENNNYNTTGNISATTLTLGSVGTAGCISIRDSDDGGWSHIQMLDGAIVNGSGAC